MIIVNFKNYKETFGDRALELAKICKKVAEKTGIEIIPAVSSLDAQTIKEKLKIKVFLQNIDPIFEGQGSGFVSPIKAKELNIDGTLLNHSEHKIDPGTIKKMLAIWPKKFESVVCISSQGQAESWAKNIKPNFVAYEPKDLIGSIEKSVASEKLGVIKNIVKHYKNVPVLVGAGIHSVEDVKKSLDVGAKGILISSYIVKASDPEKKLLELANVFV